MNERHQADLLSRWLASGAHGEPPAGLDPDVVASIYALRPELAPAPRLTLDDILDGVTAGPFSQDEPVGGGEVVPFPVPPSRPAVIEPPKASTGAPESVGGGRWWIGGGVGLLAAAAAALLVFRAPELKPAVAPLATSAARGDATDAPPAPTQEVDARKEVAGGATVSPQPSTIADVPPTAGLADRLDVGSSGAAPRLAGALSRQASPSGTAGTGRGADLPGATVAAPRANTGDDAVAWEAQDAEAPSNPWAPSTAPDQDLARASAESLAEEKMSARMEAAASSYGSAGRAPAAQDAARAEAKAIPAAPPAPAAPARPAFDANAAIGAAAKVAATDPMAAARQLERALGEGTPADGQRIALAAARYARDAGDLDKAESLARAGLARGGSSGTDGARLTSLLAGIQQARAANDAEQTRPADAAPQ